MLKIELATDTFGTYDRDKTDWPKAWGWSGEFPNHFDDTANKLFRPRGFKSPARSGGVSLAEVLSEADRRPSLIPKEVRWTSRAQH